MDRPFRCMFLLMLMLQVVFTVHTLTTAMIGQPIFNPSQLSHAQLLMFMAVTWAMVFKGLVMMHMLDHPEKAILDTSAYYLGVVGIVLLWSLLYAHSFLGLR